MSVTNLDKILNDPPGRKYSKFTQASLEYLLLSAECVGGFEKSTFFYSSISKFWNLLSLTYLSLLNFKCIITLIIKPSLVFFL